MVREDFMATEIGIKIVTFYRSRIHCMLVVRVINHGAVVSVRLSLAQRAISCQRSATEFTHFIEILRYFPSQFVRPDSRYCTYMSK